MPQSADTRLTFNKYITNIFILVQVYKEFDLSLDEIIKDGRIAEYSLLCKSIDCYIFFTSNDMLVVGAEVTARFQIISKIIIEIQVSDSSSLLNGFH